MKLICNQIDLLKGIQTVQKAISKKISPIYEGIYLQAENSKLYLHATDLEISIKTEIYAQVEEEGNIVIPNKLFNDLIKRMSGSIEIETKESIIYINQDKSDFKIIGYPGDDFLPFPELLPSNNLTFDLKETLKEVIIASSENEARSFLNGVYFNAQDKLDIVATDSHRLALKTLPYKGNFKVIVPRRAIAEVIRLSDDEVSMDFTDTQAMFSFGNTELHTRLLEGNFPDYNQIIPTDFKTMIKVDTNKLKSALERVELFTDLSVKLSIGDDLTISVNSEIGSVEEKVDCLVEGKPLEISFNVNYLIDVLKVIKSEQIEIRLDEDLKPATVVDDNYKYVLMPMRGE